MNGVTAMDENGEEVKSPIKRLGSTRKLLLFNSKSKCTSISIGRSRQSVFLIHSLILFFFVRSNFTGT